MPEGLANDQIWGLIKDGQATLVDVREPREFALGHPPGALNVPYSQKGLSDRLMTIMASGSPVILMADNSRHLEDAAAQLLEGRFEVLGVATDNMSNWASDDLPVQSISEIDAASIDQNISERPYLVLDVREPIEWEMGHVPGAMLISLGQLKDRMGEIPADSPIVVICEAGIRSSSAASLLQSRGVGHVVNVSDGTAGYRNNNLPMEFYEETN